MVWCGPFDVGSGVVWVFQGHTPFPLAANWIGGGGATAFADALKVNTTVKEINIGGTPTAIA